MAETRDTVPVSFGAPAPGQVAISHATQGGLLADLAARLAAGQGFAVATLNLDHIVKLRRDAGFGAAYLAQTHVVADGNPVVWLCRLAGRRVELVPGSDLMAPVVALCARMGAPIALVGSTEAVLAAAAARLEADHPGLRVAARIAPPMGFDPTGTAACAVLDRIAASGAQVVLLAMGAPRQEELAALGRQRQPGLGFLSIGAGLDFIAGQQRRAPMWMRRLALEWLWRLAGNPRRLAARYGACALALPGLAWQVWRQRQV